MTSRDGHCNKFTFPRAAKKKRTTASILRVTMPPKSKKRRQSLEAAARGREVLKQDARGREVLKQARLGQDSSEIAVSPNDAQGISSGNLTEPAQRDIPQSREETGPSGLQFREDMTDVSPLEVLEEHVESWVQSLDHEDRKSVGMLLCLVLVKELSFTETRAAELAANVIKKSDKTVRRWRTDLIANGGSFAESKQGRYQKTGVLWENEEFTKRASEYVRGNAAAKGKPNLTTVDFCKWVNKSLLPNSTLEPGFPRQISVETARKWLHEMGFEVLTARKGLFIDGHERTDVVESRAIFLRKMVKIGFLHFLNAPTEQARRALPEDVDPPI